jgi:hypothetical protein
MNIDMNELHSSCEIDVHNNLGIMEVRLRITKKFN